MKNKIPYIGQLLLITDNKGNKYVAVWKEQFIYISQKPDFSECCIEYWEDPYENFNDWYSSKCQLPNC